RSNRRRVPNIVKPEIRTIEDVVPMADRTMEELLQTLTEGYGEAIVIPKILAENFEIKTNLLQIWYEKEPPNLILTWDDLVNKFVNQFFPPSKTTHLKNEISCFTQRFKETFGEAWERFKEMLRASGVNLLNKTTREALKIIENKSNVRYSRSKSNVSRVNMNSRDSVSKTYDRIDKLADQISNLVEIVNKQVITPATAKAVEKTCVIYGGAHAYYDCIAIDSNQPSVCATTGSYNQLSPPNRANHQIPPPGFALVQNNPNSNTVPNPKGEMKAVTTHSGLAYEGPSIPTNSPLEKIVERDTKEIMDKEHSNCQGSTAHVQPLVVPISIPELDVLRTQPKPTIPYPSRLNDQKLREKDTNQMEKFTPTRMTLELADRSITRPKGVTEDVFVKVGKFHFPTDFVVVDFEVDPRVPLILGRSFLRTGHALIDVYREEITLRYNPKSSNPTLVSDPLISENDFCKEPIVKSSSPTLTPFGESDFFLEEIEDFLNDESIPTGIENSFYDPEGDILFLEKLLNEDPFQLPPMDLKQAKETNTKSSIEEPPELELKELPFHLEYAFLEESNKLPVIIAKDLKDIEKEALIKVLKSHKQAISWKIYDIKGIDPRFCTHKILMEEDYKPAVQSQRRPVGESNPLCAQEGWHDRWYFQIPIDSQDQEKTTFTCPYGTFAYRRMPFGLCNAPGHKISKSGIEVDRAKVDVIAKLPHPTTVKECVDAFNTLKKKLTEAPILVVPDWNLPFELMCDASDFAINAVLGQRKTKHFQPIHYASKTMTKAQIHYTTTEKEMLTVVYAFEKFRPYLVLSKSIVYTDHSTLEYLLNKQDAKLRLLRWVLLLQEFDITILDKKGSENLVADHLSRLENPHKDVLKNKDINENFLDEMPQNAIQVCEIFDVWGIDFMGPFPSSKGNKYILVAVDYLSKWVQVKALPTNDARVVVKFLKSLFSRFGIPKAILSDRGTHFCNDQFTRVMIKYGVTHRLATAYHPETNDQVEVSNRGLKRILERTVRENHASWSDKLDDALWAFCTIFKTPIGCTPYKLLYGKSYHLPIELEHRVYWALKHVNFDLKTAGDHQKLQLNELNELRDQAYENSVIYKEMTKKLHDSKIKNRIFNVGDQVLLFNSRLKIFSGKLKTRWSSPFTITQVFPYGTVELSKPNGPNFKVNGHCVKHFFRGDIPSKVVPDLHTFPMDK
nr:reverse transcriptase domain-containing protein [Tanacetum cinerariifolium]